MTSAVLDVNVIVSAILAPKGLPARLWSAWRRGSYELVVAEGIIAEVAEKLRDPEIGGAYGVTDEDIEQVEALLRTQATVVFVPPTRVVDWTDDEEDNYVVSTKDEARATYLVTGDKRLRKKLAHRKDIIMPRQFYRRLFPSRKKAA